MKRPVRKPTYSEDRDGAAIVLVPLANSEKPAKILKDDFERMLANGVSDQWLLWGYNGRYQRYEYVRCTPLGDRKAETVSRLIMGAGPGQIVRHFDGDPLNLRRENLVVRKGKATREAKLEFIAKRLASPGPKTPRFLQEAVNLITAQKRET